MANSQGVNHYDSGSVRRLEPYWTSDFFDLAAVQKSGDTQYGSALVPTADGEMRATLGYRRYLDCDRTDTPGQDYAVARGDREYLVGVLADGVGQSFFGNLAAERVSTWLLECLWTRRASPPQEADLELGLKQAERNFSEVIAGLSLDHLPDWHRAALERSRLAGSQSVFAAFIWDFERQSGSLYQVGDVTALVLRDGRLESILAEARGRWSSAGKSQLHLLATPLASTSGILLKTDGADPAWGLAIEAETANSQEFARMALSRAANDDVSFVAGCLVTGRTAVRTVQREYADAQPIISEPNSTAYAAAQPALQKVPTTLSRQSSGEPLPRAEAPAEGAERRQSSPPRSTTARSNRSRVVLSVSTLVLVAAVVALIITARGWLSPHQAKSVNNSSKVETRHPPQNATQAEPPPTTPAVSAGESQRNFVQALLADRPKAIVLHILQGDPPYSGVSLRQTEKAPGADSEIFFSQGSWYVVLPQPHTGQTVHLQLFRLSPEGNVEQLPDVAVPIKKGKRSYDISVATTSDQ